jgi:hypothetical protein
LDTALDITQTKNSLFEKFQQMTVATVKQDHDFIVKKNTLISRTKSKSFSKWLV